MANSHLSDDVKQWPSEPFAVLGLQVPVGQKGVRLAYTQLIRRFKPEKFPEQFRRIREAYDRALKIVGWNEWVDGNMTTAQPEAVDAPVEQEPPAKSSEPATETATPDATVHSSAASALKPTEASEPFSETVVDPPVGAPRPMAQSSAPPADEAATSGATAHASETSAPRTEDESGQFTETVVDPPVVARRPVQRQKSLAETLTEIWNQAVGSDAVGSDAAGAYERLRGCYASHPGNVQICLQAYWLLKLHPALDRQTNPCEWLARGLEKNGWNWGLAELYRRELERNPEESAAPRCRRVLDGMRSPTHLLRVLDWRWAALHRARRWDLFESDVERLGPQFEYQETTSWVRLLLHTAELFPWDNHPSAQNALQCCRREAATHRHFELELANEFDRFDQLESLVQEWRRVVADHALLNLPDEQQALLPLTWRHDAEEIRRPWDAFAAALARNPEAALRMLDSQWQTSPRVVRFLLHRARQYYQTLGPADVEQSEILAVLIRRCLAEHAHPYQRDAGRSYPPLRRPFLAFCVEHGVTLGQILPVIQESPSDRQSDGELLSERMANDAPLELACLMCVANAT